MQQVWHNELANSIPKRIKEQMGLDHANKLNYKQQHMKTNTIVFVCFVQSYALKDKLIKTVGSLSKSNSTGARTEERLKNAFSIQ